MKTNKNLLSQIQKAKHLSDIFDINDLNDLKKQYRAAVKTLHPDLCTHHEEEAALAALLKLNLLKEQFFKKKTFEDESGKVEISNDFLLYQGEKALLLTSHNNYNTLKNRTDSAALHFHRYLPTNMKWEEGLKVHLPHKAVPLSGLTLEQPHVNWILSRLLEICAWFAQIGYVHAGINPENVLVIPETHGVILPTFYHLTPKNGPLKTISGEYQHWYPTEVFKTKRATTTIDLELCKRTAAYLLGDASGLGIKLQKTHSKPFIDFLLQGHSDAFTCYDDYRRMLQRHFERKFYDLKFS